MRCRNDCPPDFGSIEIAVPATGIPANVHAPASAFETAVAANAGDAEVETAVAADPQDAAPPPRKMQRAQRSQQMRPRRLHCGLVWTGGRLRPVSCHANAETAVAASITRSDSQPEHMRKPQLRQTPPGLPCIMWSYARVKRAARAYNDAQQCRGAECRPCFRMARFCHGRRSKDEVKRPGGSKRQKQKSGWHGRLKVWTLQSKTQTGRARPKLLLRCASITFMHLILSLPRGHSQPRSQVSRRHVRSLM